MGATAGVGAPPLKVAATAITSLAIGLPQAGDHVVSGLGRADEIPADCNVVEQRLVICVVAAVKEIEGRGRAERSEVVSASRWSARAIKPAQTGAHGAGAADLGPAG